MSPRRLIIAASIAGLAALGTGAAMLPWSVGTPLAAAFVSRGLGDYGLALTAEGPSAMTLLPLPRLHFARTRIAAAQAGGPPLIEGGSLVLELNPLALLSGQADIGSVILDGATIHLPQDAGDRRWSGPVRRIGEQAAQGSPNHPRRITVTRSRLESPDPRTAAQDVALTVAWPFWSTALEVGGSLTWRGARTDLTVSGLRPGELLNGRASPFTANAAWPAGTLAATGSATLSDGLALSGQGRIETRSLPETLAWLGGGGVALAPFLDAFAAEGRFETNGGTISLPSLRTTIGGDVLEGAGSLSLGDARTSVQATLAAERLNLAPLVGGLVRVFDTDARAGASGSPRAIALAPLTGGDLDLRISATEGRVGPIRFDDLAASVLVRRDAVEVALNRTGLEGAMLKGRVVLAAGGTDAAETEVRAQGAFDRLDLGALLAEFGESRWVLGGTQGQFALESRGRDAADLAANAAGRIAAAIDGGMIAGLDLADVVHRNGAVAAGALARRNARTPFERASVTLKFADGIGAIGEGSLKAQSVTGSLRGQISLPERWIRARAEIAPKTAAPEGARPVAAFDVAGPWGAVTVRGVQTGDAEHLDAPPGIPLRVPAAAVTLPGGARAYVP